MEKGPAWGGLGIQYDVGLLGYAVSMTEWLVTAFIEHLRKGLLHEIIENNIGLDSLRGTVHVHLSTVCDQGVFHVLKAL